eukprot:GEMP01062143.1.p1 GENE.GEMP01062143.1~~GEMP01062143.1.p1  ORF type:complete len:380 (+),score=77.76 GEMP01062143.1:24-1142(+)
MADAALRSVQKFNKVLRKNKVADVVSAQERQFTTSVLENVTYKELVSLTKKELADCTTLDLATDILVAQATWALFEIFARHFLRVAFSMVAKDLDIKSKLEDKTKRLESQMLQLNSQFYREITRLKHAVKSPAHHSTATSGRDAFAESPEFYAPLLFLPDDTRDMCSQLIQEKAEQLVEAQTGAAGANNTLREEIDEYKAQLTEMEEQVRTLNGHLITARETIERLEGASEERGHATTVSLSSSSDSEMKNLQESLDRVKQDLEEALTRNADLMRELEQDAGQFFQNEEIEVLRREIAERNDTIVELREEIQQSRDQIALLQGQAVTQEDATVVASSPIAKVTKKRYTLGFGAIIAEVLQLYLLRAPRIISC